MGHPRFFSHPAVMAHTFFLECYLRAVLEVPREAPLLLSFPTPGTRPRALSADEDARWRALLEAPHRSLDAFLEAFRAGFAARDLPKCLRYRARADTRRDFLEALYEWSCLVRSRYVEVRWTPQAGLGLYAKQRLAASLDLSEVVGRLARISQKDEDWLAERGRNHSVVLRFF